jgi:hypothetical protein
MGGRGFARGRPEPAAFTPRTSVASSPPKPRTPANLSAAGRKLWRAMVNEFELEDHELALLEAACRQADDLAALEQLIRDDGMKVQGSTGQERLHPAIAEARLARQSLDRLMARFKLPGAEDPATGQPGRPLSARGRQAQAAANKRWSDHRRRRGDYLQPVADLKPVEPTTRKAARSGRGKSDPDEES